MNGKKDKAIECSLNPLKSGHMYWICSFDFSKLNLWMVLIPLNRVICIEYQGRKQRFYEVRLGLNPLKSGHMYWIIEKSFNQKIKSTCLNPLKSGHMYWIVVALGLNGCAANVLIPLNRVICIEFGVLKWSHYQAIMS